MNDLKKESQKKAILKKNIGEVKLLDVGKKDSHMEPSVGISSTKSIFYPKLYIEAKTVPFLEKSKIGQDVVFVVSAKLQSRTTREINNGDVFDEYCLEIKKIGQ